MPGYGFSRRLLAGGASVLYLVALAQACDGKAGGVPPMTGTGGAGGSTSSSAGGGGEEVECVGPTPPSEAYDAEPGPILAVGGAGGAGGAAGGMGGSGGAALGPKDVGSEAPVYQLEDVHPLSCGHGAVYGLDQFKGKVTIAALWAGW